MIVSLVLSDDEVAAFADQVTEARNLYGVDSAYVIGMVNAFDWLLGKAENADEVRKGLRKEVVARETGDSPPAAKAPSTSGGDDELLAENTWVRGAVKWFNNDKGYGFISTEGNADVFVHWRDISSWDRTISQGEEVEFMVTKTAKGFQAVNVMKAEQSEPEENEAAAESRTDSSEPAGNTEGTEETGDPDESGKVETSDSTELRDDVRVAAAPDIADSGRTEEQTQTSEPSEADSSSHTTAPEVADTATNNADRSDESPGNAVSGKW